MNLISSVSSVRGVVVIEGLGGSPDGSMPDTADFSTGKKRIVWRRVQFPGICGVNINWPLIYPFLYLPNYLLGSNGDGPAREGPRAERNRDHKRVSEHFFFRYKVTVI